jgi:dTDP-4-dehydrorhamnose reductase
MKIVVTGSGGQLGRELQELSASYPGAQFLFFTREQLSLTDTPAMEAMLEREQPHFLINAAAYTAVDKAEAEPELAMEVNGYAVGRLAAACRRRHCRLVHISTDYVFSGASAEALKEDAPTAPINIYGASKELGEREALANDPECLIIRTSWVYSAYGNNFVKTMLRLMKERSELAVVNDQVGSPTYALDLARALLVIISSGKWVPGIFHYSNEGRVSWFDFALAIAEKTGATCVVRPISSAEYPTPARRPAYSVMDTSLIRTVYGLGLSAWRTSLDHCLSRIMGAKVKAE